MPFAVLLFGALSLAGATKQEPAKLFRERVKKVYSFKVADLSNDERQAKFKELDAFWALVEGDKKTYLPLLRGELSRDPQPQKFFLFNGTQLLMKYSKDPADLTLAESAISRCDLDDVASESFFRMVHHLAIKGVNVTASVEKILDTPDFSFFLVQHAMTLKQDLCVYYCVLPMKEEFWIERFIKRLKVEKDPVSARSMIIALYEIATEKATAALIEYSKTAEDEKTRKMAARAMNMPKKADLPNRKITAKRELLFTFLDDFLARRYKNPAYDWKVYREEAPYLIEKKDYARLKEMRRKHSARVSDEALYELSYISILIRLALTLEK